MIDGSKQQLAFDSNENGVEIFINGRFQCSTPCLTEVKRSNKRLMVTAKKDGFNSRTLFLDKSINSTAAFNVISLWSSTFGASTDMTSSSMWEYQPGSIYVVINKEPKTEAEKKKIENQNMIRNFVLRNFDHLQAECFDSDCDGEYAKALIEMTKLSKLEIKSVFETAYVPSDCAERIIGLDVSK